MVRSALFARVSNHETINASLILRDAAKRPLLRMRFRARITVLRKSADGHRRQTGAAAAASPEMAVARQARTGADDDLRGAVLRILALGNVPHPHAHHPPSLPVASGTPVAPFHLCDFFPP